MRTQVLTVLLCLIGAVHAEAAALDRRPYRFDAGSPDSEVAPNTHLLTPVDTYDAARGFGWTDAPERGFTRPDTRRSRGPYDIDGVAGMSMAFRADVPDGRWWLTMLVESGLEDSISIAFTLNGDRIRPAWQAFDPPAEGRAELQKIYRLLHRPIDVANGTLRFSLQAGADTVRVLGFSLMPDPVVTSDADRRIMQRIRDAGAYGSDASLEALLTDLAARATSAPDDAFAAYWHEQISWLRLAERYREQMGWEAEKKRTGLGIFDRYHGAVMILDGLLDRPDAESWPLYERALFERGRILYWLARERGGEHETATAERDHAILSARYPDDPLLAMYRGEQVEVPDGCDKLRPAPNAPEWSKLELEALCRMRAEIYWWVRERQDANGEFGGKLGDDVELLRPWHPLLVLGDTVALRGLRTLADGVWSSDEMSDGYAADVSDVEHASEFVSDTAPALALYSDDPAHTDRLRPSARHFEELWTGITPGGRRHFKSAWFSASALETDPPKDRDVNYNARATKALRFLAHETGDAHVIDLLHEWSLAWAHAATRTDKGKPPGILPASIRFPDEAINGDEPTWYDPNMYWDYFRWAHDAGTSILDQLFHTYILTKDEALLQPLFDALDLVRVHENVGPADDLTPGSAEWAAANLRDEQDFWTIVETWRLRTDDDRYDDLILKYGTSYARYRLTGDEKSLLVGLEPLLETLRYNTPMRTTEVLHTDRVYMPGNEHLQAMLAGGGTETSPYLAVSWSGVDSTFTALVTDTGRDRLGVDLFSHADVPRTVELHVHDLDAGTYRLTRTTDGGAAEEGRVEITHRGQPIDITLPPRTLVTVRLESVGGGVMTPRDLAKRVANRIVAETEFRLVPVLEPARQEGAYPLDFRESLGPGEGGLFYARAVLTVDSSSSTQALMGISSSPGGVVISVDGKVVHQAADTDEARHKAIDYDLLRLERNVPLNLPVGRHELLVKFAAAGEDAEVILYFADPATEITLPGWTLAPPGLEEDRNHAFLVIGPFDGGVDSVHPPDTEDVALGVDYAGKDGRRVRWDVPRVHLVSDVSEPLDFSDWRYFTGTILSGLDAVGSTFDGLDYEEYIDRHLDFFLNHRDAVARQREDLGLLASVFGHYFRYALLDDYGMQTVPYAERILRGEGTAADTALVRRAVDAIVNDAARLPDGTFARYNPDSLTVWADDLFMGSIILLRAAEALDRPELLDEAARQALLIHDKLIDEESGLYWHGWFGRTESPSSSKWARANGWTMMAKTEILQALPPDHPLYDDVLDAFRTQAEALVAVQADDGRWHQVLDNPDTYL
ncbi:MAG TPA: glycoside hydrolase family 88 protein, partial [Rhodothermales bacterium]